MEYKRVFELLEDQNKSFPQADCLASKVNGTWVKHSTQDVINIAENIALGLRKLGIEKGDKVAIISNNRPEWNFVDFGIQFLGAVSVPMYPTITADDYAYIFNDSEAKIVFVEDREMYDKVAEAQQSSPNLKHIFTFDNLSGVPYWNEVHAMGKEEDNKILEQTKEAVDLDDLLTLIYTSGTTGRPKGVMLTHKNILKNTYSVAKLFPIDGPKSKALSFLPLCHIFERTATYTYMRLGLSIYYAENLEKIADNLKEVQPHTFTTVPRLLEKVYAKIVAKGYELEGIKKNLFFWALNLGLKYEPNLDMGFWYNFKLKIANKLIFSKWREALGNNIEFIVSGAAALQPRLARVFWAGQIRVLEAYGLTETSPGVAFNRFEPENVRVGTVGPALEGVEIKIAADGEVLVRGDNVMQGYYNKPELTKEVIDEDGWFHTGDVGELVEGKFLKITDRKKEMFKTSGGKYIAPQAVENKFKESTLIEQIMVVGEGEKFPAALIVPLEDAVKDWFGKKELNYTNLKSAIETPEFIEKMNREMERYNKNFAQFEKVKKFKLLAEPWGIEGGELTPTLKLKRKNIAAKFEQHIADFYKDDKEIV
ncbi:MAG: long-chain fatty acid--CoA ligase [Cyclobacteriaceae bacterium]|nr:long-chain fatty acid--CoA ligase [Cyclobacteriaceae bacterium]MCH8517548.1 long-chain fatty acid--CoA ligase [Cyclobacteriaceae bacterium]